MLLGGARFTCLGRHGNIDLETALMHSCNMYFYHAGEALGGRRLYEWYARFGMGLKTGIDMAGESGGILPKNAFTRRGWATGNTYHMAIGQGIAVTPLQMAVTYAALANAAGNTAQIVRPHLLIPPVEPPETPEAEALAEEAMRLDRPLAEILIDREALAMVRQGMWEAVQGKPGTDELGTGRLAAFPDGHGGFLLEIAGKTGTAEWSRPVGGRVVKQTSHVWFAGYAPFDRPELVVLVLLPEAGIGGGSLCAPIAKDLIRMWFNVPDPGLDQVVEEGALG
jgi:penicillin-binding protein 2